MTVARSVLTMAAVVAASSVAAVLAAVSAGRNRRLGVALVVQPPVRRALHGRWVRVRVMF